MARTLKQTKTIKGTTSSSSLWTWKQVVREYFEEDYISSNKSIVVVKTYLGRAEGQSSQSFGGKATTSITCDGKKKSDSQSWNYGHTYISGGEWFLIQTEEFEIEHEDDGTKKISVSSSLSTSDFSPNSASASGSVTLTTIPRASLISISNYDLGQNPTIVIGKKVDSFTSTLTYEIGGLKGTIVEKTSDSSYVWQMSEELISQIKINNASNKAVNVIVYCDTYNEDTHIGDTMFTYFVLTITDKPVISNVVREELNSNVSQLTTKVLKSVSQNQFTITAEAPMGTTISSYKITNGTQSSGNVSNNIVNLDDIQTSYEDADGNLKTKFVVTCTDARGNTSDEYPLELDFINYVDVAINKTDTKIRRTNSTSSDAILYIIGNFYNGLIGETQNKLTIKYQYKKQEDTAFSELIDISELIVSDGNKFEISDFTLSEEIDYQENYQFVFYVNDILNQSDDTEYLFTSSIPIAKWHKNGAYIKNIDTELLLIDEIDVKDLIRPIGSTYITESNTDPANILGFGTWELYDKEFKNTYSNSEDDIFTINSGVTSEGQVAYVRGGHTIRMRLTITTAKDFTDSDQTLGTIDMSRIGTTNIIYTTYTPCYISDDAVGIVSMDYNSGALTYRGVVGELTTIESGADIQFDITVPTSYKFMPDEFCDKFYWRRTA